MSPRIAPSEAADRVASASGLTAVVGRPSTVVTHQRMQRSLPSVVETMEAIRSRVDEASLSVPDKPLFIFSAGWRSGSTLLQRLLLSTDTHFIWGEPYHRTDIIRRLAESLIPLGTGWPPENYVYDVSSRDQIGPESEALSDRWVANTFPPVDKLLDAHRAFLRELLAPPAPHEAKRWGLKEVRLSAEYGYYARLLFPQARLIFLVRDPRQAYASYREHPTWFERWPRSQVRTPYAYGQVWRRLAESFLTHAEPLGATLVRYEDLVKGGEAIDRIEAALGAEIDRGVLEHRIRGSRSERSQPSALELRMLRRATRPVAAQLGYGDTVTDRTV